ncbi:hypothetical protein DXG01_010958 [Tephrocybe rancida]|nr:hypothetical protein DXG01_010958 [Tephrocybe rancida]
MELGRLMSRSLVTRSAIEDASVNDKRTKLMIESSMVVVPNTKPQRFSSFRRLWPRSVDPPQEPPQVHQQKLKARSSEDHGAHEDQASTHDTPPAYSVIGVQPPSSSEHEEVASISPEYRGRRSGELALEVEEAQAEIERLRAKIEGLNVAMNRPSLGSTST